MTNQAVLTNPAVPTTPAVRTTGAAAVAPPEQALMRRGFPGPASAPPADPALLECDTPVPTPAHDFPRAIRVRRSPR
jgi:hypothetical protein